MKNILQLEINWECLPDLGFVDYENKFGSFHGSGKVDMLQDAPFPA